jgi:hypothetical protein
VRQHGGSTAAGGHGWLGKPAHDNDPARRPEDAHPTAGGAAPPELPMPSCQRADARWLSSHPRMRAGGRTVATHRTTPGTVLPAARQRGWEDGRERHRRRVMSSRSGRDGPRSTTCPPPRKAPSSWPRASAAGRTDAVRKHGGRRAWGTREIRARRRSRDTTDDRARGGRCRRAPGATHALLPAR